MDSNYKINPLTEKEAMFRSLFFSGDSIAFFEDSRPQVDTGKGKSFGIQFVKTSEGDTLVSVYSAYNRVNIKLNEKTPQNLKVKNLYLSFPNGQAHWKFGPNKGTTEIRSINLAFPNNIMSGTFPLLVGATVEALLPDTGNILRPVRVSVPDDTVFISLK